MPREAPVTSAFWRAPAMGAARAAPSIERPEDEQIHAPPAVVPLEVAVQGVGHGALDVRAPGADRADVKLEAVERPDARSLLQVPALGAVVHAFHPDDFEGVEAELHARDADRVQRVRAARDATD